MNSSYIKNRSIFSLGRELIGETKVFLQQEIQLARTEMSEKLASKGKSGLIVLGGSVAAIVGATLFLIGLGWLLGFLFFKAGLSGMMASFLGFALLGFLVACTGVLLAMNGLEKITGGSVMPKRAAHVFQQFRGKGDVTKEGFREAFEPGETHDVKLFKTKLTSEELEDRARRTEERISEHLDELQRRTKPGYVNTQIKDRLRENLYRNSLGAVALGILGGWALKSLLFSNAKRNGRRESSGFRFQASEKHVPKFQKSRENAGAGGGLLKAVTKVAAGTLLASAPRRHELRHSIAHATSSKPRPERFKSKSAASWQEEKEARKARR